MISSAYLAGCIQPFRSPFLQLTSKSQLHHASSMCTSLYWVAGTNHGDFLNIASCRSRKSVASSPSSMQIHSDQTITTWTVQALLRVTSSQILSLCNIMLFAVPFKWSCENGLGRHWSGNKRLSLGCTFTIWAWVDLNGGCVAAVVDALTRTVQCKMNMKL